MGQWPGGWGGREECCLRQPSQAAGGQATQSGCPGASEEAWLGRATGLCFCGCPGEQRSPLRPAASTWWPGLAGGGAANGRCARRDVRAALEKARSLARGWDYSGFCPDRGSSSVVGVVVVSAGRPARLPPPSPALPPRSRSSSRAQQPRLPPAEERWAAEPVRRAPAAPTAPGAPEPTPGQPRPEACSAHPGPPRQEQCPVQRHPPARAPRKAAGAPCADTAASPETETETAARPACLPACLPGKRLRERDGAATLQEWRRRVRRNPGGRSVAAGPPARARPPPSPAMLFHSLAGSEMHGVIDEMDRRAKGDTPAISSAIDRGETHTVGPDPLLPPRPSSQSSGRGGGGGAGARAETWERALGWERVPILRLPGRLQPPAK